MTPAAAFKKLIDNIDEFDVSLSLTREEILELGLRAWAPEVVDGEETGRALWLFPLSFFEHIPAGFPVVDINFKREVFNPDKADNDTRFGMLAFGVLGKAKAA